MRELTSLAESNRKIALDRYHSVASLPDRTQRLPDLGRPSGLAGVFTISGGTALMIAAFATFLSP